MTDAIKILSALERELRGKVAPGSIGKLSERMNPLSQLPLPLPLGSTGNTDTEANVERAKERESNFSDLLDRLLARWLGKRS